MDRNNLLLIAFFLLAGVATWIWNKWSEEAQIGPAATLHVPDYYTENMVAVEMDENGVPARSLTTLKWTHYADDSTSDLSRPYMIVFDPAKPPWEIRSATGWVSSDGNEILLKGQVTIDREAAEEIRPMHMVTSNLRILNDEHFAETKDMVHSTSLQDRVDSIGLRAWLKAPMHIFLETKARARYEP